jgi:hypothetical protein
MRAALDEVMAKIPVDQATPGIKAHMAEFILKAAAEGLPAPALRTWRPFPMRLDFWISSGRVQCRSVRRYSRSCLHATSSRGKHPSNAYDRSLVEAFRQGLSRVGLIENRDIILDVAWVSGDPDQAVRDVLRRGAEVLIPCGSSASVAAKRQTSTIPIVFVSVGDPIAMGLVASLPRPGHNATGFSDILADLSGKLVDLSRGVDQAANNDRLSLAHRMAGTCAGQPLGAGMSHHSENTGKGLKIDHGCRLMEAL